MSRIRLTWNNASTTIMEQRVYRSTSPLDIDDMPDPLAVLPRRSREYLDSVIEDGLEYYYAVSSVLPDYSELISEEIKVEASTGVSDPHWDKVVALLRFDGNLNNEKGAAWSIYGAGTIDTANPIFGIGSLSNTGRGGAVSPNIERIDTNDSWTIEGFVYCIDRDPLNFIYTSRQAGANSSASTLYFGGGDPLSFQIFSATGTFQGFTSSAPLMPLNVVTHVAVCFDKPTNTLRIFQAGQKVLEETVTTFWTKSRLSYLACWPHTDQPTRYLRGRLDEWRETVGVARYTENFTPPTGPFPNN